MRTPSPFCLLGSLLVVLVACESTPRPPTEPSPPRRTVELPAGWEGYMGQAYAIGLDRQQYRSGSAAAYLASTSGAASEIASLAQSVRADNYRGHRVRWTGWVRHENLQGTGAGLWMRVDGPGVALAYDDMEARPLLGTGDWHPVSVVLDVPANALGIWVGVMLTGTGDLVVDDLRLEVVGEEVPSTNMWTSPRPSPADSLEVAATFASSPSVPVNLDFAGIGVVPEATVEWLALNSSPFATVAPGAVDDDLEPLRAMIGGSRMVGMGEGTHGTREFFQLKHRMFQFLVRQMGFTHFAIEASWPESNDLNRYVLEGVGDPARLLSRLHFWTWNTEEVLDLIHWMREWNRSAPPGRHVQFLGFDMQAPGAAIDTVAAAVARVDPATSDHVEERLACIWHYRNHIDTYAALPAGVREACRAALQEVFDLIHGRRAEYAAVMSDAAYENLLRSARLVQQFEALAGAEAFRRWFVRDAFMAENALWLLEQAPPDARMMLWAHNLHVSRAPGAMGDSLHRALGDSYVNLGFLFGTGSFNAIGPSRVLEPHATALLPPYSMESIFQRTEQPRLLFDARSISGAGAEIAPLREPIRMRSIGSGYDLRHEEGYFVPARLPEHYDLLMYVETSSPTRLLPFGG